MEQSTIGIAWFSENDWDEWKLISEDELEDQYIEWVLEAAEAVKKFEEQGFHVEKVYIKPKEFMKWCKKNNKSIDSDSRSEYVTEILEKSNLN